jgi:tyrosyl-tRNA synthetase
MDNIIDDLNYRGLIEQYSSEEAVRKLLSVPTTIYCGFDPSASSMHIGNFVMISILVRLQKAGHRIIAVVGGATGMVGDPSGKSKERNLQTKETLAANTALIKAQLERFLDLSDPKKGIIVNNYDWLGHLETLDFLRDYGKYFPINYMLSKEIVSSRLEAGISFTEFSYQILQAIDFYHLNQTYGCRIQIGGNDQWGNLTSGMELIRKLEGDAAECEVMTAHLITRADGKKFGKSEQGALFLDPKLTSPYQLYQYFINTSDDDAVKYLKVFTFLSHEAIEDLAREHFAKPGERIAQKRLAYEVVGEIHGKKPFQ